MQSSGKYIKELIDIRHQGYIVKEQKYPGIVGSY